VASSISVRMNELEELIDFKSEEPRHLKASLQQIKSMEMPYSIVPTDVFLLCAVGVLMDCQGQVIFGGEAYDYFVLEDIANKEIFDKSLEYQDVFRKVGQIEFMSYATANPSSQLLKMVSRKFSDIKQLGFGSIRTFDFSNSIAKVAVDANFIMGWEGIFNEYKGFQKVGDYLKAGVFNPSIIVDSIKNDVAPDIVMSFYQKEYVL